jgi:NCS1 family nucleobase:cation symporter-1
MLFALLIQYDDAKDAVTGAVYNNNYLVQIFNGLGMTGLAAGIGKLGVLHLFFLFLPVFVLSIVLYTVLAGLAGAKEKYPQAAEAERVESKRQADEKHAGAKQDAPATMKLRMARAISLLMLAICVIWPVLVYTAGDDFGGAAFMAAWATLKAWLIVPSVIYFIAATIWAMEKDKLRSDG